MPEIKDNIGGYLEVGTNELSEVVVNLPQDMTGHIVFSPNQARHLANLLLKHANSIDGKENELPNQNTLFEFDKEIEWILGRPNFWCAAVIAPALRALGQQIPTHAEEEQAAAIYWMLTMYMKYGNEWREKGNLELETILNSEKEKANA